MHSLVSKPSLVTPSLCPEGGENLIHHAAKISMSGSRQKCINVGWPNEDFRPRAGSIRSQPLCEPSINGSLAHTGILSGPLPGEVRNEFTSPHALVTTRHESSIYAKRCRANEMGQKGWQSEERSS